MNIQQLEYIIAVDERRHFAKAAEACHVTQPTLSMMIQKLEDELNVRIFDRSRHPVEPTANGLLLIAQARNILLEVERLHDIVRRQKNELSGELRVGIIPTLAPYLVHRFINRFLEKYPGVVLNMGEYTTAGIIERLKKNQLDVGILVSPLQDPSLKETPLFYEPLAVFSWHQYPKKYLMPEDIEVDELLLLEEGHCLRSQIMNLCELRKQTASRFRYESGSLESLIRLVSLHQGVTILPALAVEHLSDELRRQVFPFNDPVPVREVSLATHRDFLKTDLIAALRAEIIAGVPQEYVEMKEKSIIDINIKT